jgi:hypothetical protein
MESVGNPRTKASLAGPARTRGCDARACVTRDFTRLIGMV